MTTLRDQPYAGGFVLTRANLPEVAHFSKEELPNGWFLWCDHDLVDTEIARQDTESALVIRGHWADLSDTPPPSGQLAMELLAIASQSEEQLHERLARIAGRYVVIAVVAGKTTVVSDSLGLRSIYYSTSSALVSSHARLLLTLEPHDRWLEHKPALTAWDESPWVDVRHLLPNFALDPERAEVWRVFPRTSNRYRSMSAADRLARVEELWHREMQIYADAGHPLAISVTGGLDSRLMLAMAREHLHKFRAFTYTVPRGSSAWSRSIHLDGVIVEQLLPYLGLEGHDYIDVTERPPRTPTLDKLIRSNSWTSHGHYLLPHYRRLFPTGTAQHLRGTGVEIIRRYWPRLRDRTDYENVLTTLRQVGSPDLVLRGRELGYEGDTYGYELMDLVYWEVRMGKWHSELLNESDAAFDTFVPIATREIFELLLAFDAPDRECGLTVTELINRNFPLLNFIGANDSRNLYEQVRDDSPPPHRRLRGHVVLDPQGEKRRYTGLHPSELVIPHDEFVKGASATALVMTTPENGTLQLTVQNDYESPQGAGVFSWHIMVGSREVAWCDGAATKLPVRLTIKGLKRDEPVKLRLRALKTMQKRSWQLATLTTVKDVEFFPSDNEAQLSAAADCPDVHVVAGSLP